MKIRFLLPVLALGLSQFAIAQDSTEAEGPWKTGTIIGLNFSQTYLDNWQGGGQSAINGTTLFNAFANYSKGKVSWESTIDAAYGISRIGNIGQVQKTDDRIEINSKFGVDSPLPKTEWMGSFTFRTQWDAGYDYATSPSPLISDPLAPAYIITAIGMDYKPSPKLSLNLSPLTSKITIVDNQRLADEGAFGVVGATFDDLGLKITDGENIRSEVGGLARIQFVSELVKNVKLTTRAEFFSNYLNNPQNIDVNWETMLAMKVNSWLSASITTHLIYDDDIKFKVDRDGDGVNDGRGPRTQFKEVFALGLQFQL